MKIGTTGIKAVSMATGALLVLPTAAQAATTTTNLNVSATVSANCTASTTPVAFGSIDVLSGSSFDATGGVTVTCTNGTAWSASAGLGGGAGATFASRKMTAGANLLNYTLYTDSGRTTIWGDGTGGTAAVTNTGSGTPQNFTVYGRVLSGQATALAGAYSDTVLVTVTY